MRTVGRGLRHAVAGRIIPGRVGRGLIIMTRVAVMGVCGVIMILRGGVDMGGGMRIGGADAGRIAMMTGRAIAHRRCRETLQRDRQHQQACQNALK